MSITQKVISWRPASSGTHLGLTLERDALGFFYLNSIAFWSLIQQSLNLLNFVYTFSCETHMPRKKVMFDRSNYDRKSQLAGIRTYLLTPPGLQILDMITKFLFLVLVYLLI